MKKVAVILSGCGYLDGSEIYESVITLLALDSNDAKYRCFAPDIPQMHTINHITGEVMPSDRNVLIEASRIARGDIADINTLDVNEFDAIIFPGGFGAAKNLSNFAIEGTNMSVTESVAKVAKAFADAGKPAGYICIAPALAASIYGGALKCTIGKDVATASAIDAMGGKHIECAVDDVVIDETHKVVTTPAYMLANRISEAAAGIEKLVSTILTMIK
jgi:enhancing lycopene biosynthesis protein 2